MAKADQSPADQERIEPVAALVQCIGVIERVDDSEDQERVVRAKSTHDLCKDNQLAVHDMLRAAGIEVYVVGATCTDARCQAEKPRTHEALARENRVTMDALPTGTRT
jgi:hypothetical protein